MGEYLLPDNESQPVNSWSTSDPQQQNYASFDAMPIPGTSSNQNQQLLAPATDQNSIVGNHTSASLKTNKKASLKAGSQGGISGRLMGKAVSGKSGKNSSDLSQGENKAKHLLYPNAIFGHLA